MLLIKIWQAIWHMPKAAKKP